MSQSSKPIFDNFSNDMPLNTLCETINSGECISPWVVNACFMIDNTEILI